MQTVSTLVTLVARGLALLGVWWILTLGDVSGLLSGVVTACLVAWLSLKLFPVSAYRLRPLGLILFAAHFLYRSVIAGLDVARRVLSPALPVNPGELTLRLHVPKGSPRWLLANTLSLMPGTLSVSLEADQLTLHCLDIEAPVEQDVRVTERRVARVFRQQLTDDSGGSL
ncbi:MAG: Na+/H+ antiporter subunit E [Chromatocurvus sp.]